MSFHEEFTTSVPSDSTTVWQWQRAHSYGSDPRWSAYWVGRGGRQHDPDTAPTVKNGGDLADRLRAVIIKERQTRRQQRWNAKSYTGGSKNITPEHDEHKNYSQLVETYAPVASSEAKSWLLPVGLVVGGWLFLKNA